MKSTLRVAFDRTGALWVSRPLSAQDIRFGLQGTTAHAKPRPERANLFGPRAYPSRGGDGFALRPSRQKSTSNSASWKWLPKGGCSPHNTRLRPDIVPCPAT